MDLLAELTRRNLDPALISALSAKLEEDALRIAELSQQTRQDAERLRLADIKIQSLTLELAHHKRIRFAAKSELFSVEQRALFEETSDIDLAAITEEVEQQAVIVNPQRQRPRAGRQPLPDHLPRIVHYHEPDACQCGYCGGALVKIGEDVSEQLDVEPARFFVHRHIRPQYACRPCETITAAPIPPAIIDGGMAAAGLLSWIAISKYVDHLPLYRIEQIAARQNVSLAQSTLADWIGKIGVRLQPLADRLRELLLQRNVLHADETPVAQLDPGKGKTQRAYLWAYRSSDLEPWPPIVVFDYQPSRRGEHAAAFLDDWRGHLMVDDYAGYKALFNGDVIELACLAHARRKFFDLHAANQSPIAAEALQRIAALYAIEQACRDMSIDQRQCYRQTHAKPLLAAWHAWLINTRKTVAQGSGVAKAIDYSLKRWPALMRYADSGLLPIDNNPIENNIRPIAIGKKNWLFAGSERAGKRAAAIQSLVATAKLNGVDPDAWLRATLEKLPTWSNSRIDELLPLSTLANPAATL